MKKLLASLLAIVMALSLAAPAFADGPDGPPPEDYWENAVPISAGAEEDQEREELAARLGIPAEADDYSMDDDTWEWIAAHEKETKEFLTNDFDDYLHELGYESVEDYAENWSTMEGAVLQVLEFWVNDHLYDEKVAVFRAKHPDLIAQFEANAYNWFAENNDWCPSAEEYMKYMELTQAEFVDAMVDEQIRNYFEEQEHQEWLDEFEASHPGMLAWFEANAYDYYDQNHGFWFGSAENYMKDCGYTEEEFIAEMVEEQIYSLLYKEEQQEWLDQMKTELGGVPGQVGVMIDGKYVQFPDAAPELVKGRTMAPLRAVMEALGAEVSYGGKDDIRCTAGGFVYTFAIGSSTVKVRPTADNGADVPMPEDIVMDCAPYIKGGRTYVPVRFFAEALGYTVEWDSDFKTAVLTDKDSLIETIDKDFTILNRLLAARQMPDAYKASTDCTGAITIFNSMDGDRNSTLTVSQELTASPAGMSETMKYDLSGLMDLLQEEYGAELLDEADQEQLAMLKALLSGTMELCMDQDSGMFYLSMPALSALMEQMGMELPKDAWFSTDIGSVDFNANYFAAKGTTMGALIAAGSYSYYPVYSYSETLESAETAAKLLGDGQFTRSGSTMTLTVDKARLEALADELDIYEDMPREFSFVLTVRDSGACEYSLVFRTPKGYGYYGDSEDMRITLSGSASGLNADMKLEIHLKNQFKLALTVKQTVAGTSQKPQTTPPEGAVVIPLDELGGYSGWEPYPDFDGLDPDFTIPMESAS